ncbi:DUF397 domain-containing protein [Actinocorallia longicatena]|uniref:DUF397 domain-containing protein n=1 Tax=Actinocorallia longicatena TaxID=111803 RepID=A0ABP6Q9I2_9ACTN
MNTLDLSSADWRKSSHSGTSGGDCVEVAAVEGVVAVRDSKNPGRGAVGVTRSAFGALVRGLRG